MEKINWGEVEGAGEFKRIVAGGYVCEIVKVQEVPEKQYLKVWADVVDGEFKNVGQETEDRTGNDWGYLSFIRSYKPAARPFFKGFLTALEESNPKFKAATFDGDERHLIGLQVGLVLGEEEYVNKAGEIKSNCKVQKIISVKKIKEGNYTVPAAKKVAPAQQFGEAVADDTSSADIPF